ncbi:hypothetical protein Dimus_024427 [Dionaea muscipula]
MQCRARRGRTLAVAASRLRASAGESRSDVSRVRGRSGVDSSRPSSSLGRKADRPSPSPSGQPAASATREERRPPPPSSITTSQARHRRRRPLKLPDPSRHRQAFTGELHRRLIHHQPKPSQPRRSPATHQPLSPILVAADRQPSPGQSTTIAAASIIQICRQPSTTEKPSVGQVSSSAVASPPHKAATVGQLSTCFRYSSREEEIQIHRCRRRPSSGSTAVGTGLGKISELLVLLKLSILWLVAVVCNE